jgi:hypothetical protein
MVRKPRHKRPENIEGRVFGCSEKDPDAARGTIHYDKMRGISVVRCDDTVGFLIGAPVVLGRGSHKPKVHEEFSATGRYTFCCSLGGLFANVGLFLEFNVAKRVVFEHGRRASDVKWEDIKLLFSR